MTALSVKWEDRVYGYCKYYLQLQLCNKRPNNTGNKLERDMGDIVSLQAQMSPLFQLREKFKCIEHIDKSEIQLKPKYLYKMSPDFRSLA